MCKCTCPRTNSLFLFTHTCTRAHACNMPATRAHFIQVLRFMHIRARRRPRHRVSQPDEPPRFRSRLWRRRGAGGQPDRGVVVRIRERVLRRSETTRKQERACRKIYRFYDGCRQPHNCHVRRPVCCCEDTITRSASLDHHHVCSYLSHLS
jgi:hypothetical protein